VHRPGALAGNDDGKAAMQALDFPASAWRLFSFLEY